MSNSESSEEPLSDNQSEESPVEGNSVEDLPELSWIPASDSPWNIDVLDVRPITLHLISTSKDPEQAETLVRMGYDTGTGFRGRKPTPTVHFAKPLEYRIDRFLAPGPLFSPREMEHKWAIFFYDSSIICVRSWTAEIALVADVEIEGNRLKVTSQHGSLVGSELQDQDIARKLLDFLIRTHCLDEVYPVPMEAALFEDPTSVGLMCMSLFGNMAYVATPHHIEDTVPETPIRSNSLLHIAVAQAELDDIQAQLDAGVPVDLLAKDGLPPLHWALSTEGLATLQFLIDAGSPVDVRSDEGATALMNAVQSGDQTAMEFLLEVGADVNASDDRGFTSLHRAAEMGNLALVKLLVSQGADKAVTAQGHTATSLAKQSEEQEVMDYLESC